MDKMIEGRLKICQSCEFNISNDCVLCGCDINSKVQILEEKCPLTPPRWSAGVSMSRADEINKTICVPCSKNR